MISRIPPELFAAAEAADVEHLQGDGFAPDVLASVDSELLLSSLAGPAAEANDGAESDDAYVPDHYEPNYAYPLIAWLHTEAPRRALWKRLMRQISERNYVGASIVLDDPEQDEEQIFEAVARLRRRFHLHTERVYLLGFEDAGTRALRLAFKRPEWFGGVAAISARFPKIARPLARFEALRGRRVLLGLDERDSGALTADVQRTRRLLWSAGMQVTCCMSSGGDRHAALFREIDRWIMQGIEQPEVCSAV